MMSYCRIHEKIDDLVYMSASLVVSTSDFLSHEKPATYHCFDPDRTYTNRLYLDSLDSKLVSDYLSNRPAYDIEIETDMAKTLVDRSVKTGNLFDRLFNEKYKWRLRGVCHICLKQHLTQF